MYRRKHCYRGCYRLRPFTVLSILICSFSSRNVQNRIAVLASPVPCTTDDECQALIPDIYADKDDEEPGLLLSAGSICNTKTGFCTNPFESGCLYNRLPGWNKKRVCNSEDDPDAVENGLCVPPQFDEYMEVRISSGNWESIFFNSWLVQILFSEMLGVPTTLEPALPNIRINYYDTTGAVEFGEINNVAAFNNSFEYTDCRLLREHNQKVMSAMAEGDTEIADSYMPCSNYIPEYWTPEGAWTTESVTRGSMEPPQALGVLARETLFVPKFTVERDPTLVSYIGLQGEENRQKLADTFLRPTTWKDYCEEVSSDNCATATNVTQRPPKDDEEGGSYFVKDLYTGHFRKTERNIGNDTNPPTGHVIDYPCDWTSYVEQQLYYLNISLSGDNSGKDQRGYPGWEMQQILQASNATKSDIIMIWAQPDPWYQRLVGTDMELYPLIMPPATQICLENKRDWSFGCSADVMERVGDPRGACEDPPIALHKAISTSLIKATNDPSIPDAARSPAVAALKLFTNSAAIYGSWFDLVIARGGLDADRSPTMRDATCQWVVDNFEKFKRFVPASYPRIIVDQQENTALVIAAIVLATLAITLVIAASALVWRYRNRRVMVVSQVEFLFLLLVGLLIMTIGSLVVAISPTNASCVATIWLVYVGYTVELAPLLVKVSAVNRLMKASQRFQKVKITRKKLFGSVLCITSLIVIYLSVWTAVDAPEKEGELTLSTTMTANNETIVYQTFYCTSDSDEWEFFALIWTACLLFSATVLAVQMRNVRQEFNESQTLGIMTYSHFVFLILRMITFFLTDKLGAANSARYRSILLSVDAIATLVIYFLPKFIVLRSPERADSGGSSMTGEWRVNQDNPSIDRGNGSFAVEKTSMPSSEASAGTGRVQFACDEIQAEMSSVNETHPVPTQQEQSESKMTSVIEGPPSA